MGNNKSASKATQIVSLLVALGLIVGAFWVTIAAFINKGFWAGLGTLGVCVLILFVCLMLFYSLVARKHKK